VRLFVALMLGDGQRRALASAVAGALGERLGEWRRPSTDGLHLTLVFLGATEAARLAPLERALARELAGAAAPELVLQGTGAFPRWSAARVLWIGVREAPESAGRLSEIHDRTLAAVAAAGFAPPQEDWRPHITVARARRAGGAPPAAGFRELGLALPWRPAELAVVESRPVEHEDQRGAQEYVPLARVALA
jgi:2'-5' RNA ligase